MRLAIAYITYRLLNCTFIWNCSLTQVLYVSGYSSIKYPNLRIVSSVHVMWCKRKMAKPIFESGRSNFGHLCWKMVIPEKLVPNFWRKLIVTTAVASFRLSCCWMLCILGKWLIVVANVKSFDLKLELYTLRDKFYFIHELFEFPHC